MDRIWQWAWDRHGGRYLWVLYAIILPFSLPEYLFLAFFIVAVEKWGDYVDAAAVVVVIVLSYMIQLPGVGPVRVVEQWAAGHEVDRAGALESTYDWGRAAIARAVPVNAAGVALRRAVMHGFVEAAVRPARVAVVGDTAIGDSLPRSRPSLSAWSSAYLLVTVFVFGVDGAMLRPRSIRPARNLFSSS